MPFDKNNSFFLAGVLTVIILLLLWVLGTDAGAPKKFIYLFAALSVSVILHEHLIKSAINANNAGGDFAFGDPDTASDSVIGAGDSAFKFDAISSP